jgi:hypothetical protein
MLFSPYLYFALSLSQHAVYCACALPDGCSSVSMLLILIQQWAYLLGVFTLLELKNFLGGDNGITIYLSL